MPRKKSVEPKVTTLKSRKITPEQYAQRLELAELVIKENEALKKQNDAKKAKLHAEKQQLELDLRRGKVIDLTKHKQELIELTNIFISAVDKIPIRASSALNAVLPDGLSSLQAEDFEIKMKGLIADLKREIAGC